MLGGFLMDLMSFGLLAAIRFILSNVIFISCTTPLVDNFQRYGLWYHQWIDEHLALLLCLTMIVQSF